MSRKSQDPSSQAPKGDLGVRAWRAVMELHGSMVPLLDDQLQSEAELDIQTYDALLHVYEAGDQGIRMTDLARNIVLSKSGLTTLVDRLEKQGLMQRIPDPGDRRAIRITLTDQGIEAFRRAAKVHVSGIQSLFATRLTDEEAKTIATVLERVNRDHLDSGRGVPSRARS